MKKLITLLNKIQSNNAVVRAEHTAWQAAAGAVVASLSSTHGDVRAAIVVGVAAALSAVKTIVVGVLTGRDAPAVPVEAVVAAVPAVAVDVVSTPSTPASPADPGAVPPVAS